MSRTVFNELGENRVINPRSGFSQFVDLSNNQTISGIKTFLNDLITNANVNCKNELNSHCLIITPSITAPIYRLQLFGTPGGIKKLYYNISDELGLIETINTIWKINGAGNFSTIGSISSNTINSNTGTTISSPSIWNYKNSGGNTVILLDPTLSATNRLQIHGEVGLTKYLYFNTSNVLGFYKTAGVVNNIWSIDGDGNILTIGNINNGTGTITTTGNISGGIITGTSLSAGSGTISTSGTIKSNTINCNTGTIISSTSIWNYKSSGGTTYILLDPTLSATNRLQIYSEVGYTKYLYFNTSNVLGFYKTAGVVNNIWSIDGDGNILTIGNINNGTGTITTTGNISGGIITGTSLSAGSGTISTTGSISGVGITGRTLTLKNASTITNITLDATTTSGDRLVIYGIASGTRYLYYNTSNNIGVYNSSTGTSVWSIDGTTGNIVTIGSYSVGSFSATSFLCNSISPLSGTTFTFGITSNCNWLKSAGVNRILMFPSSTSGDIMQICRTGNNAYGDGYWYHNNTGNFGYNTGGISVWELLNTGGLVLNNNLVMANTGYSIFSNTLSAQSFSTYRNSIRMNQLFTDPSISSLSFIFFFKSLTT